MHQRFWHSLNVLIAALLIVTMVSTTVPTTVFAASVSKNASALARLKTFPKVGKTRVELDDRRTAKTKEYINPDGSFTIESYAEPVHYKNTNGLWTDIDNQLVASDDPAFQYKNKANSFQASFATDTQTGDLVRVAKDQDHWLAFTPDKQLQITGQLTTTGLNKGQTMKYGLDQSIQLNYILDQNRIKEEIVLSEYPGTNSFTFYLRTKGLTYAQGKDGLYHFTNEQGESLFYLEQPFATDSNEAATTNASLQITPLQGQGKDLLTVTVDDTWLKQATYPVVIDPSVVEDTDSPNNCSDTFASSLYPTTKYNAIEYIVAGTHPTYGETISYVRWDTLPSLPVGASIDLVELRLNMYMSFADKTTVHVSPVTSTWSGSTLDWSHQPSVTTRDTTRDITDNKIDYWDFDITDVAQQWYDGTLANNGVQLAASPDTANRRSFRSSNYTSDRPALRITYTLEPLGIQSFWGYAGNTNVLNGNLVVSATDVTLPGRGIPISISRTYNSRSSDSSNFGYGWTYNVGMKLAYADGSSVKLTDGTGSSYYFTRQPDGSYKPPVGIYYKLYKEDGVYVLQDLSGVKSYFDAQGRLDKIVDTTGNTTDIVTDGEGLVTNVVDPSGRYAQFNYISADPDPKRLDNIKLNTTPGTYPGSPATELAVSYAYDAAGNLQTVTKPKDAGSVVITFGYDSHNLNSITDPLGKVTQIGYDANDRVASITKSLDSATSGILAQSGYGQVDSTTTGVSSVTTTLTYQPRGGVQTTYAMVTSVTDPRDQTTVYSANDQGNIVKIVKGTETYELGWDQMQNLLSIKDPNGKDTVMSYDGQGNMLNTRNPEGNSAVYHYNADVDVVSTTDYAGRSTVTSYDDKRQVVVSTNQQSASSVTSRATNGNVTADTSPMTLAENLLTNTGFESWTSGVPTNWQNVTPAPGTVTDDTANKVNGRHGVKIYGQTDAGSGYGRLLASVYTPVQSGGRYAVSWSAKTDNMGTGGAGLIVHWYNSSKTWINWTPLLEPVSGTTDWSRHVVMVDAPTGAVYARVELRLKSAGTAWYDNVQLERGTAVNAANQLTNEGFEVNQDTDSRLPDGWWSSTLVAGDGVTTAQKHSGSNSVLVNAASSGKNYGLGVDTTGQNIAGVAGTTVTFSGWIKTANMTGQISQLKLKVTYADGSLGWFDAFSSSGTHDWEYVENTIVVPKDFTRWALYGWVLNGTGQAWFDDFSLHIYGSSSALASDYNMLTNGSFEVDADASGWPDDWTKNHSTVAGTYDIAWVGSSGTFMSYTGAKAVRVQNTPGWVTLGNSSFEMLKDDATYTATAMMKTDGVTAGGGAIKFDVYNGATLLGQLDSETISGSKDWTKLSLSYSTEDIKARFGAADRIQFVAQLVSATTGKVYFDGMRMTEKATVTGYTYDGAGNYLQTITNSLGKQVSFTNDTHGNVQTVTDPLHNTASFTYDALDRLKTAMNTNNLLMDYGYDDNGNLQTVTQKDGVTLQTLSASTSVYNELGLVTKIIDPMNQITEYRYDQNGNLAYVKTASGQEAWFVYDEQDRLSEVQYVQSQVGQMLIFTYDKNGNRLGVVHKTGDLANPTGMTEQPQYTYSYEYDSLNRVTKVTLSGGQTVNYTYNPVGQVTSIGNSSVDSLTYSYDYTGLNTSVSESISGTTSFIYDELGRVTKAQSGTALTTLVEYNAIGQVTSQKTVNAAGTVVAWHRYEYDDNGNRTKDTTLDDSYVKYGYDAINELLSEEYFTALKVSTQRMVYTYDRQGNRLTKAVTIGGNTTTTTYTYNAANEMTAINGVPVSYEDGNQQDTGDNSLVFNTLGQVVQLLSSSGQPLEQYEYNADGLRTAKLNASGTVQEKYFYNGSKLAYVTDGTGKLLYYFTRTSSGALLSMVDCTGATKVPYWYVKDAHGNVLGLADASGNVAASYTYDAWGNELSSSSSKNIGNGTALSEANPFRYSSYYFDETSGLYYLNARYYSPKLGRFLSKDSVSGIPINGLSQNVYLYTMNNPVNAVDQEGTWLTYQESVDEAPRFNEGYNAPSPALTNYSVAAVVTSAPVVTSAGTVVDMAAAQKLKQVAKSGKKVRVPQSITSHADEVLLDVDKAASVVGEIGVAGAIQATVGVVRDVIHYRSNPSLVIGALMVDATAFVTGLGLAAILIASAPVALPLALEIFATAAIGAFVDGLASGVKRRAFDPFIR